MRSKIIELFEYRELPKLIRYKKDSWDADFYEKLIQLQYDIYLLDHELETNWKVDMKIIENRWSEIYNDLHAIGLPAEKNDYYCKHIYKYQKHELEIRKQKLPTRLSMEYFYFYKSCDVKLLRRLIYDNNPELNKVIRLSDWRLFDLVTEINDDVEDLQEDVSTINGNRFLISLLQFGKENTRDVFVNYLDILEERNNEFEVKGIDGIYIKQWTAEQISETKQMVIDQIKCLEDLDVSLYDRLFEVRV